MAILIGGYTFFNKKRLDHKVESLSSRVEESMSNIVEISSVRYNYTDIAEFKDVIQFSGINIPFTNKSFLVKYSGYVKAGLSLNDIDVEIKDPETALVKIENLRILDNVINEEEVYFYNEKDSTFNRLSYDELYELLKEEKLKLEEDLIEKGILEDAANNIEDGISNLLYSMGVKKIEFIRK